jgi:transcriptional regulator with XRE-family HTH domain
VRAELETGEASGQGRNEPHPVDIHVALRMRERRIELRISQQKLAAALGITNQQLSKYEKAQNRISAGRLYELSQALDVPVTFFFEGITGSSAAAALVSSVHEDPRSIRKTTELTAAYRAIANPAVLHALGQLARALASKPNASTAPNPDQSQSRRASRRMRTDRSRGGAGRPAERTP